MPAMELILAAPEQQPILANLLELYIHDFSEFHPFDLNADGRFGYAPLPLYWSEPGRYPFLIKADGKLAGLAFVKKVVTVSSGGPVWDMAEFFVLRAYRRQGIGKQAAHAVWRRFPGPWQVRIMQSNRAALLFWQNAIHVWNGQAIPPVRIEKEGNSWHVFSFESSDSAEHSNE